MYCLDASGITLRGAIDGSQLQLLQNWVANNATTLYAQGTTLTVDKNCKVQIQYLSDQGCVVSVSGPPLPLGAQVGVAAGGGTLLIVLLLVIVVVLVTTKRRKSKMMK